MKTFFYSHQGYENSIFETAAKNKHELIFSTRHLDESTVHLAKGCEAISIFTSDVANAKVLTSLQEIGIRYIALRSAGYDHVDLQKASHLKIKVANVPAYSPYAIAEFAVALLLALNRHIFLGQKLRQKNDFRLDELIGFDLHSKTIGIVGTGRIGAAFAKIMHGFGCRLIGYDLLENKELMHDTNLVYTSFEELCKTADVISVHCPLLPSTYHLFDKKTFQRMKKGAILINTARGGIVNTADLIEALRNETIASAGLDVYENEKNIYFRDLSLSPPNDSMFETLRLLPNVLLTSHQAFLTQEALQGIAETTMSNLTEWEANGISENDLG